MNCLFTYAQRFAARHLLVTGVVAMLAITCLPAAGQMAAWPTRPVRLVVGFAPGGTTDVMARAIAQSLSESIGITFIVDNKPGASGNLGASEVVKAAPDGYTFFIAPTSVETVNPSLFKSSLLLSRDLTPVMGIGRCQMYLVTRPTMEVKDARQLIALAKARSGKLSYASAGAGTSTHLAGELLQQSTGIVITHVPYKGSAPALQDVMASQVDFVFDSGIGFPHIKAGKVKLLAVASDRRSPFFPDTPSYADLGIHNASLENWFGIWAPNKVPAEILDHMAREVTKALQTPAMKQRLGDLGAEPAPLDNAAFRKLLVDESKALTTLIKERKIFVE